MILDRLCFVENRVIKSDLFQFDDVASQRTVRRDDDVVLMESWEQSFQGRPLFKWIGFFTIGVVSLVVLLGILLLLNGVLKAVRRK